MDSRYQPKCKRYKQFNGNRPDLNGVQFIWKGCSYDAAGQVVFGGMEYSNFVAALVEMVQ